MPHASQSISNHVPIARFPVEQNHDSGLHSILGIMTQQAAFLRRKTKKKTKPCIFENPNVLQRLATAFSIGGTVEEAAHFAGCSVSVVKKHMREHTPFQITAPWGESCVTTFDEMVNGWRSHITLLAKLTIYKSLYGADQKLATKNAWKILDRVQ